MITLRSGRMFTAYFLVLGSLFSQPSFSASYSPDSGLKEAVVGTQVRSYYGKRFYELMTSPNKNVSDELRDTIELIMNGYHSKVQNGLDEISHSCSSRDCYKHTMTGYNRARVFLLGQFYLVQNGNSFGVQDVYCNRVYTKQDFGSGGAPGPMKIPDNAVVNVEHTWPQSKFTSQRSKEEQKSDLHHLFPTDSELNSIRGNNPFGDVVRDRMNLKCNSGARFGYTAHGAGDTFEPPDEHKGNVARALFYFAIKYGMSIGQEQEAALRRWNKEDPVDMNEYERNNEIYKLQGSLNPFVDHPQAVDLISDF